MTEASREPELADPENPDKTALNLASASNKTKPLPERGTWSTKLDFILSVVTLSITIFLISYLLFNVYIVLILY